ASAPGIPIAGGDPGGPAGQGETNLLDFSYLQRLPTNKIGVYRNLETALRQLEKRIHVLTFTQAQAEDGLAEWLIALATSLEEVRDALGNNQSEKLSDTFQDLRASEADAEWAVSFLISGDQRRFPQLRGRAFIKRVQKLVRELLKSLPHFGDPDRK